MEPRAIREVLRSRRDVQEPSIQQQAHRKVHGTDHQLEDRRKPDQVRKVQIPTSEAKGRAAKDKLASSRSQERDESRALGGG